MHWIIILLVIIILLLGGWILIPLAIGALIALIAFAWWLISTYWWLILLVGAVSVLMIALNGATDKR